MIKANNKVLVQQLMKTINNKTGEINYLIVDENKKEWKKITKKEYEEIRGN